MGAGDVVRMLGWVMCYHERNECVEMYIYIYSSFQNECESCSCRI